MIAPIILLHPISALAALFRTNFLSPLSQLGILRQVFVVYIIGFGPQSCFSFFLLNFLTSLSHVVDHITSEAVLDTTHYALQIGLVSLIFDVKIVATICRTLNYVIILVSDFLPLELLASFHLLWAQ